MAYRKLSPLIWDDAWFVELEDFPRLVWIAILTGPQVRPIPGLMIATAATIADYLRRDVTAVATALADFAKAGRVELDPRSRVMRVVNGPRWAAEHGEPENPNVLKGWWKAWKELPDCPTKRRHLAGLREAFVIARDRSVANERDQDKARVSGARWDAAWNASFGLAEPPMADSTRVPGTVSAGPVTVPETVPQTVPGTVSEPFQDGSRTVPETIPTRTRAPNEQEPEQEQEPEPEQEISHTHRAGERAQGDVDEGVTPSSGACSLEDFARLLGGVRALDVVTADRMAVAGVHEGFVMAHKGRATLALAEKAIAVFVGQGVPEDRLSARAGLSRFLCNQRPDRVSERPSERGSVSREQVQQVIAIFAKARTKKKHSKYVASEGDEEHAAELVKLTRPHVNEPGEGNAIVKHWAEAYLDDVGDRFVVNAGHPLRMLPRRVGQYGLPPAKNAAPTKPTAPEPPPPSAEEAARLALEHRAKIASIGTGGATTPVARPS